MEFTQEEKQLIKKMMMAAPLQGTIQTLPRVMEVIVNIIKKLDGEVEVAPSDEVK